MIQVRVLRPRDWEAACALLNQRASQLPYCWPLHPVEFQTTVLNDNGAADLRLRPDPAGWLVAVSSSRVLGLAQAVVSGAYLDPEPPQGWLRLLEIAPDASIAVIRSLLQAVDRYFQRQGVYQVTAFAPETGYAHRLAGRGWLPGDRLDVLRALGEAGYQLRDRWLMYEKRLLRPQPETLPRLPGLRLQWRSAGAEQIEFWLHYQHMAVAHIHVTDLPQLSQRSGITTASLDYLFVAEEHRRQGLGRWLLQRAANELFARQVSRFTLHINHQDAALQSLLLQVGYEELPLRGYTYEKSYHVS